MSKDFGPLSLGWLCVEKTRGEKTSLEKTERQSNPGRKEFFQRHSVRMFPSSMRLNSMCPSLKTALAPRRKPH